MINIISKKLSAIYIAMFDLYTIVLINKKLLRQLF